MSCFDESLNWSYNYIWKRKQNVKVKSAWWDDGCSSGSWNNDGFFFCPTYMKIGFKSYSTEQYITFLRICCSGIILKWRIWRIVVSTLEGSNRVFSRDLRKQFLQLMLKRRTVFSPHSVVHVPIQLKKEMKQYVIEPCNEHLQIVFTRIKNKN